jgi:hypothetical protein
MLINTIPVLEAQASPEIENILTTADRLLQLANAPDNFQAGFILSSRFNSSLLPFPEKCWVSVAAQPNRRSASAIAMVSPMRIFRAGMGIEVSLHSKII